jgi:hypothetical protein
MCSCWIWEIVAWGGMVEGLGIGGGVGVGIGLLVFEDTGGVRDGGVCVVNGEGFDDGSFVVRDPGGGV